MEESKHDLETLSQAYSLAIMRKWEESYRLFQELETTGIRDFQRKKGQSAGQVYQEMMDSSCHALGLEQEYDNSVEEITNAFIYSANSDIEIEEFRKAASSVLREDKKWKDYAEESV